MADSRLIVAALGLSQIIGYGTLYYGFSVLAPQMAEDLAWSKEWVFGAFSLALLAGGLAAPFSGRWVDRFGAGRVMTSGSVAAALALIFCACAPGKVSFVVGLAAIEVASSFVQYSAAFALLVQIDHERAPRNITYLTLIAGFASTLLWPITAALQAQMSWRDVYLVFAAVNLLIGAPIHFWLSTLSSPNKALPKDGEEGPASTQQPGLLSPAQRPKAFLLMVIGFSLLSFVNTATLAHMLPALAALGLGAMGVLVSTLFGPAQVLSRLINMIFGTNLPAPSLALVAAVLEPLALVILLASAPWIPGAVAFSIIFGLGSGLSSIVQGTLPLYLFGKDGYGALIGRVTAVRLVVSATAPFVFAFVMESIGIASAVFLTVVLGIASNAAFLWICRLATESRAATTSVLPKFS
ncbi:arsenite efflux MFS transporter ArsK [Labrys neptuniae]